MEDWVEVHRLLVREGRSKAAIARVLGMSRNTARLPGRRPRTPGPSRRIGGSTCAKHPDSLVRLGRERRAIHARQANPEETSRLWRLLDTVYPTFATYRARSPRTIPVVLLEPRRLGDPGTTGTPT